MTKHPHEQWFDDNYGWLKLWVTHNQSVDEPFILQDGKKSKMQIFFNPRDCFNFYPTPDVIKTIYEEQIYNLLLTTIFGLENVDDGIYTKRYSFDGFFNLYNRYPTIDDSIMYYYYKDRFFNLSISKIYGIDGIVYRASLLTECAWVLK